MCKISSENIIKGDSTMQQINAIVSQLKTIMQDSSISLNHVVSLLEDKCSRNTILPFMKGDSDCKLSTLLMILDALGADLRIETERSREAIISGDIASYRTETEQLRAKLAEVEKDKEFFKTRYDELIEKNTQLTNTVAKMQGTIDRYMQRMENAENALYTAMDNIRRKDERIVELSKACGKW